MKKLLRTGVAFAALIAAPAMAADLERPVYRRPVAVAVVPYSWTGFYIGVNGGYGWSAGNGNVTAFDGLNAEGGFNADGVVPATSDLNSRGGFGGGQIGYNLQRDRVVFGVEADIQGAGIKRSSIASAFGNLNDPNDFGGPVTASANSQLDWFGTARVRIGYAFDRSLVYFTGGFAFGGVKDNISVLELSEVALEGANGVLSGTATHSTTATGYVLGGGWEYAFSPVLSLKVEYQYMHLGSTTLATLGLQPTGTPDCCDAPTATANFEHNYNTVRVGLNYKFGYAPAPAVYK